MRVEVKNPTYNHTLLEIWYLYGRGTIFHHKCFKSYSWHTMVEIEPGNYIIAYDNANRYLEWYISKNYLSHPEDSHYAVISFEL